MSHFLLMLHGHLPFVRHPEHELFLEEDWLFEAVADCYLPLLDVLEHLKRDNVPASFTMGFTPPLATMLADPLLQERTARYLRLRRELAEKDAVGRSPKDPLYKASQHAVSRTRWLEDWYMELGRNLPAAFAEHWRQGRVELVTCGATHGLFPMLNDATAIRGQLWHGVEAHQRIFGRAPEGIWLPECGVWPGVASLLAEFDLRYTFVESHAVLLADPPPTAGVFAPIYGDRGVAFFGRDPGCARQVWSAQEGYPGDPVYREFYRDLGWDLPEDVVKPYIQATGDRKNTGLKYHRVTGKVDLGHKQPYDPEAATARAWEHGWDFARKRAASAVELQHMLGQAPVVVAPFDAELFGHWWFEGPTFIEAALRGLCSMADAPKPTTAPAYLTANPEQQVADPAVSSWGDGGYFKVWCNAGNDTVWKPLQQAREHFSRALAAGGRLTPAWKNHVARQAVRELLLAQASDWPFILTMDTQVGYAGAQPSVHLSRFWRLMHMWDQPDELSDEQVRDLHQMEARDNIFRNVNPDIYRAQP